MSIDIRQAAKEIATDLDAGHKKEAFNALQNCVQQINKEYPGNQAGVLKKEFIKLVDQYEENGKGADLTIIYDDKGMPKQFKVSGSDSTAPAPNPSPSNTGDTRPNTPSDQPPPIPTPYTPGSLPAPDSPTNVNRPETPPPVNQDPIDAVTRPPSAGPVAGFRFNPEAGTLGTPATPGTPGTPGRPAADLDPISVAEAAAGKPAEATGPKQLYDPDRKIGGSMAMQGLHYTAQLGGTIEGLALNNRLWRPEIEKPLDFKPPSFEEAKLVGEGTVKDLEKAGKAAHGFLRYQHDKLAPEAAKLPGIDVRNEEQLALGERFAAVKAARDATGPKLFTGNNAIEKVDFSNLDEAMRAQKNFGKIGQFEVAQQALIDERLIAMNAEKAKAVGVHEKEISLSKRARNVNVAAFLAAEAVNVGIDQIAPRNDVGWATIVGDLTSPLIMTANMTPLGKFAPLAKAATIVGTHAFTHFVFDKQNDEQ